MTSFASLLLVTIPTLIGLALLGAANAKRRRTQDETTAPAWQTPLGIALCLLSCFIVATTAGLAAVLIWIAALGSAGWAMTNGLSIAPSWFRARIDNSVTRATAWIAAGRDGPVFRASLAARNKMGRPDALQLFAIICTVTSVIAAFAAWRTATTTATVAERLVTMQAMATLKESRVERASTLLCLDAFNKSISASGTVRDLLSRRSFSIVFSTDGSAGDADTNLQRCILANGDEGAAVEEDKDHKTKTYIVSEQAAANIHDAILDQLTGYESIAALAQDAPDTCRQTASLIDPNVSKFVVVLQSDRAYPKALDVLESHPYLDRAARDSGLCP